MLASVAPHGIITWMTWPVTLSVQHSWIGRRDPP
jgi:hypothetical protein